MIVDRAHLRGRVIKRQGGKLQIDIHVLRVCQNCFAQQLDGTGSVATRFENFSGKCQSVITTDDDSINGWSVANASAAWWESVALATLCER